MEKRKMTNDNEQIAKDWIERARAAQTAFDQILSPEPYQSPPDGWFVFGSHVGFEGPLEFSEELDGEGYPRWERHPPVREEDDSDAIEPD
jgi:hypothetical protein